MRAGRVLWQREPSRLSGALSKRAQVGGVVTGAYVVLSVR